jgi:hypothetical protein
VAREPTRESVPGQASTLRSDPLRALDIVLCVVVIALLTVPDVVRFVLRVWATIFLSAAQAFVGLVRTDPAGAVPTAALAIARLGLASIPAILLIYASPFYRRLWLIPVVGMLVICTSIVSLTACAFLDRWLLLIVISALSAIAIRFRSLRWAIILPYLVLSEVVPRHGLLFFSQVGTDRPAYRRELLQECARREGTRPLNIRADLLTPYHGITLWNDELALLTGEGPQDGGMRDHTGGRPAGSWWLRRTNGSYQFDTPSGATGNLWRGCILDQAIWTARANHLVGAKVLSTTPALEEKTVIVPVPGNDMDFGDAACSPERDRLYVGEAADGGLWEVAPDGSVAQRHPVGGVVIMSKRRFDGKIVMTNTGSLIVFDPQESRVIERAPAGFFIAGLDLCQSDGSVVVADVSGRIRIFKLDASQRYQFSWGLSLFAPRRVAFSPDCSHIAATSADDHRVFLVDAGARRLSRTFYAGPALREVAATGPREFSVTDVCSLTTYRW